MKPTAITFGQILLSAVLLGAGAVTGSSLWMLGLLASGADLMGSTSLAVWCSAVVAELSLWAGLLAYAGRKLRQTRLAVKRKAAFVGRSQAVTQ